MKKEKYLLSKYHKPKTKLYLITAVIALIIRISPASIGVTMLNTILNDLSIGVIGSAFFAWLIDWVDCNKRNEEKSEKERMILKEYHSSISHLKFFVARRSASRCSDLNKNRSFAQWLFIYTNKESYKNSDNPENDLKEAYKRLMIEVEIVINALTILRQQYFLLVSEGFVQTDDFKQHIDFQSHLCSDILEYIIKEEYSTAKDTLMQMVEIHDSFSGEDYSKEYSWKAVG